LLPVFKGVTERLENVTWVIVDKIRWRILLNVVHFNGFRFFWKGIIFIFIAERYSIESCVPQEYSKMKLKVKDKLVVGTVTDSTLELWTAQDPKKIARELLEVLFPA